MSMKKLVLLFCLLFLAACAKPEVTVTQNVTANVTENKTAAPVETFGRIVVSVGSQGDIDLDTLIFEVTEVQAYLKAEDEWVKLTSAKVPFDLVALNNQQSILIDAPVDPGEYTQLKFRVNDAEGTKGDAEYEVVLPNTYFVVNTKLTVAKDKVSSAQIIFLPNTISLLADKGYMKPSVKIITTNDADVIVEDKIITVTGGTPGSDDSHDVIDLYTEAQLLSMKTHCSSDCKDACVDTANDCVTSCEEKVENGCDTEDEDLCRDSCNEFMHPADCRDGCQESTVGGCMDHLVPRCSIGCSATLDTCNTTCSTNCR